MTTAKETARCTTCQGETALNSSRLKGQQNHLFSLPRFLNWHKSFPQNDQQGTVSCHFLCLSTPGDSWAQSEPWVRLQLGTQGESLSLHTPEGNLHLTVRQQLSHRFLFESTRITINRAGTEVRGNKSNFSPAVQAGQSRTWCNLRFQTLGFKYRLGRAHWWPLGLYP